MGLRVWGPPEDWDCGFRNSERAEWESLRAILVCNPLRPKTILVAILEQNCKGIGRVDS